MARLSLSENKDKERFSLLKIGTLFLSPSLHLKCDKAARPKP